MADSRASATPTWLQDRWALGGYRLRAAQYGLGIRLMRPYSDVLGILGLVGTVAAFAITVPDAEWRLYGAVFGALLLLGAWPAIRYLGSLSAIMHSAASTEEGTRKLVYDMGRGMAVPAAYPRLCELYRPLIAQANADLADAAANVAFEFVTVAEPHAQQYAAVTLRTQGVASLTTLLGVLRTEPPTGSGERRAQSRQKLMESWRNLNHQHGMSAEDGDNYCLAEIRPDGDRLLLDLSVGTYGQISRTCEALVNEFALFALLAAHGGRLQRLRPGTMLRCLPWRRLAHRNAGSAADLFLRPGSRAAGVGVALVTVTISGNGQRHVYLGERSGTVGTYPNVLHVIPAGNCNTYGTHRQVTHSRSASLPPWYLQSIMRCEYLEEWFNDEQFETVRIPDWRDRIDELWAERVHQISPIRLTGLAYDLLNLRPEVCAMVEVAFSGTETLNWEYKKGVPPEKIALRDSGSIPPNEIVQSAAGALLLARLSRPAGRPGKRGIGKAN